MTLYGRVVDGVLTNVGNLPTSERRLDTLDEVVDLAGVGAEWRRACGWYDLETLDPATVITDDPDTLAADIATALAKRDELVRYADNIHNRTGLTRSVNWDWIDSYCHPTVAQIPYVAGESPDAGADWGTPTAAQAADRLRLAASYAMVETIQVSLAVDLLVDAVAGLLAVADLAPPVDR